MELKAGNRRHGIPLLVSEKDMQAGGSGRIDGGRLSERVDFTLEGQLAQVEFHLAIELYGPWWWSKRSQHLVARCPLPDRRWAEPTTSGSSAPEWYPLQPDDVEDEGPAKAKELVSDPSTPALLLRVQSFDAERIDDAASRERLFYFYSANGKHLLRAEVSAATCR